MESVVRRPSRSRGSATGAKPQVLQVARSLRQGLVHRPAITYRQKAGQSSSGAPPPPPPGAQGSVKELPPSVGQGNLMVATWVIGKECDPDTLGFQLAKAPFDCIVLCMSAAIADGHDVLQRMEDLADMRWTQDPEDRGGIGVFAEKAIIRLKGPSRNGRPMYVAVHRAKVTSATYADFRIRSRGRRRKLLWARCVWTRIRLARGRST